ALNALGIRGGAALKAVLEAIRQESGGNPKAVNRWDSNAKAGMPSKGLMQVIPPTFAAYAGKMRGRGIFHPIANIYAAVNYARSRYGSGWMRKITAPGGYASGGMVQAMSYDQGGLLQPGYTLVHNGTGKPEPVGHDLVGNGGDIVINFNGTVLGNQRAIE